MDIRELWEDALRKTEIIRPRVKGLSAHAATCLPYVFLAESSINVGDTVVRRGEVLVERPSLLLPNHNPLFEGFEFEKDSSMSPDQLMNYLLIRGIRFPSLKYNNVTHELDIFEGGLSAASRHHLNKLQKGEDVDTGLFLGPEECWQFSVLIYVCSSIMRSADSDIRTLLDEYRRKGPPSN